MKRDPALVSLSHDHHHALVAASALTKASAATCAAALAGLQAYWIDDGQAHFRAEEEILFPAFAAHGDAHDPLLARALCDHVAIRQRIQAIDAHPTGELTDLHELGCLIQGHVRFEERTLFPLIEAALSAGELEAVAAALAAGTTNSRAPMAPSQTLR